MKNLAVPPSAKLIIANDNDTAGYEAAEALASRYQPIASIVSPPEQYKDWNEALCAADAGTLARYACNRAVRSP